ncbi:hypothetical protein [Bradyrhizobium sp.]|uniref:hypothetical protein n=1 Tax=Bradyrhizobium sp. TaxID=376 RepID=UPI002D64D1B1|nr:hypothetical protein [Bradyrhizobium sp.]HZR72722.1 hypothetical protein [Bradyrhizobium sp.]
MAALNSVLTFDDLWFVEHFSQLLDREGPGQTLLTLWLSLDMGGMEYRLYGLSKIIQFGLWLLFGTHAWAYAVVVAASQLATGYGIFILLRRLRFDPTQRAVAASIWVLSPFAVTSCFHYFSYEIFPYQLTVACALVLQLVPRPATVICLALLGAMIGGTGESHLVASPLILIAVVAGTPMSRSVVQRIALTSVPLAAMATAVVAHRWIWLSFLGDYDGHVRFTLAIPSASESISRFAGFSHSVLLGLVAQLFEIMTLGGIWAAPVSIVAVAAVYLFWPRATSPGHIASPPPRGRRPHRTPAPEREFVLVIGLLAILAVSLLVVCLLALGTGQINLELPRRYGFVPYTLLGMLIGSLLTEPLVMRRLGAGPAGLACAAIAAVWLTLEVICLPVVRTQDMQVWQSIRLAMSRAPRPAILFDACSTLPNPDTVLDLPIRKFDLTWTFESPLAQFWWAGQYAVVVLGARYAAFAAHPSDEPGTVMLEGTGFIRPQSLEVEGSSVIDVRTPQWANGIPYAQMVCK